MEEVTLSITKEDGEITDFEATLQSEAPALVFEKVEEGVHKETTKEDERKTSKRHKSARSSHSDHPCSRGAFHELYVNLSKKGQLGDMPRYVFYFVLTFV